MISISIISHGHGSMVERLVAALIQFPEVQQIIVTLNIPEQLEFPKSSRLLILKNKQPVGFASNHNIAFEYCNQPYFCPLNPDIQIPCNPFPSLLSSLDEAGAAIVAPIICTPRGDIEDSARRFPTITLLLLKFLGLTEGRCPMPPGKTKIYTDWIAGMFLLFPRSVFAGLHGFDSRFFLYYEDVDICARAWKAGVKVILCPSVMVIHVAQRTSHRNLRYLRWHIASMIRYFCKHWGRLPEVRPGE